MPIVYSSKINPISQNEFHEIDYKMVGLAFGVHHDLGPFFLDEKIYRNLLAARCEQNGFTVNVDEPIKVSFDSFQMTYHIDLLVNNSAPYVPRAADALTGRHKMQTINLLALTGLHHAQLMNFYPQSVEKQFVSTSLTKDKRLNFTIHDRQWHEADDEGRWLKHLMAQLLTEWGAFLDTALFYEAIFHFRGGKENVVQEIKIQHQGRVLGSQLAHLLNARSAFKITALTDHTDSYERHLLRFLSNTFLERIQWINFNRHDIIFKTIERRSQND